MTRARATHAVTLQTLDLNQTSIHIDDHDIGEAVCGITFTHLAGRLPELQLDLTLGVHANLHGVDITIDDATRTALLALGWTPPPSTPPPPPAHPGPHDR